MGIVYEWIFTNLDSDPQSQSRYIGSKNSCRIVDGKIVDTKRNSVYTTSSRDTKFRQLIDSGEEYRVNVLFEGDVSYQELLAEEKRMQEDRDVVANPKYFNKSIAMQNNYSDPEYATYRHHETGKVARLPRTHPSVQSGEWVGVTKGVKGRGNKQDNTGENNPFYGKEHTPETKKRIGEDTSSRWEQDDGTWKQNIRNAVSKANKGVPKSKDHRKKISQSGKGYKSLKSLKTGKCVRVRNHQDYDPEEWVNPVRWKSIKAKENQ